MPSPTALGNVFSSFRVRLFGLVVIAVIPLVGLFAWNAWQARETAIGAAKEDLSHIVRLVAHHLEDDVRSTHELLYALAAHPDVRAARMPGCGAVLRAHRERGTRYSAFLVLDLQGRPLCHSEPGKLSATFGDREYFLRAVASRSPVVGRPVISRATGRAALPTAVPILDAAGEVERVIAVGIDLAAVSDVRRLAGAAFTIWDADGTVLYRHPDNARWLGKRYPDLELTKALRSAGTPDVAGLDGVVRIYAVGTLEDFPEAKMILSLGVDREALTGRADRVFAASLAALAVLVVAVLVLGWVLAERYLRRPVAMLDGAQRRLAQGDLTTRVAVEGARGELGRLLLGFNSTAAALEGMHAELKALNRDLEQRVAQRTAELQRASEMKSQFLATMSHELRTPLNAIIGFAEVLKDGLAGDLSDEQKTFVGDIHTSGRHLLSLINDILDLSKVEAGMMTLEREPVEVAGLLQGGITMVKERAMKQRVSLELQVEPGLPRFAADARKLKQIVFNLLANAVKFTPEGGRVRVAARRAARAEVKLPAGRPGRIGVLPEGAMPEFVAIEVADSGIGIAEADLDRLFQPFVQVDSALGRRHQGTGLGLALVKRLAELHGGTAGVASASGKGSSFFVWLPLVEAAPKAHAGPAAVPVRRPDAAEPLALIVDDDDDAARMIERALRGEGFRCRRAATAEEALVRAVKERPDLITLDIFLPHMDGWDFLERLKADPDLGAIPVVIVSVASNLEHGLALGATRVLQKPFSKAELQAALAGIVAPRSGGEPCTVLIVDDNPQAVEVLAALLPAQGYRVLRAYGGREAVEAAQRERPDLILLDLQMPEVSGFDVVERIKHDPATAAIPVVVVTAKDLTAEDRVALNGSVERIVAKAELGERDFVAEVRRAMRRPGADA